ncbi:ABC transporter substrate-binding protein [Dactylosporangium sp. CA-233914]|uniref:ABC transporter substrate-binding protein n=1 Tax=Dactylosporangium sp. CA-233914 TaxID=3239934 RepID=UPI003D8EE127
MKFRPRTVAAGTVLAVLALAGCSSGSSTSGTTPTPGSLVIGTLAGPTSFDPSQAHVGMPLQFFQPVYDSLLRRQPDGELVPMLATAWSYDASRTHLTLTLRHDVTFSDGTKLDGNAVKINLDRFRTGNGPDASSLAGVEAVEVKDASTVVISLKAPDPALLDYLATEDSFIASPKAINAGAIATDPVGSGPYTLDRSATVEGASYTFVKRPGYWDPSLQRWGKIVLKPLTDQTAMLNALLSGQVNVALLSAKTAGRAKSAGKVECRYSSDWSGLLIFDRAGEIVPALKDPRVRQAINYAIDRKTLLDRVAGGFGAVTNQVFGPATDAYEKSLDDSYPYDPQKAKALLAEAGYGSGFTVTMPSVSGLLDPAMTAGIGQNLADVGVKVNWQNTTVTDLVSSIAQGKYAMAWYSLFQGSPWVAANQMITKNASFNPFHTTDPVVDGLVTTLQMGTESEQSAAAKELNEFVTKQAWFAPFYRADYLLFSDPAVSVVPQVGQSVPSIYNYAPKR